MNNHSPEFFDMFHGNNQPAVTTSKNSLLKYVVIGAGCFLLGFIVADMLQGYKQRNKIESI